MRGLLARARSFWRGLRKPDQLEAEMDEEMRFHIEMEAERLAREQGLDPEEALRQAAIAFGGIERRKEEGRDVRGITRVSVSWLDFKLGLRILVRYPAVTLVGGVAIAFGIGVGTTAFEVAKRFVYPDPPFGDDRIVGIVDWQGLEANRHALHDFGAWREELRSIDDVGAFRVLQRNLVVNGGVAEPIRMAEVSASAFRIASVAPLLGRPLLGSDERPGSEPVVVIGQRLWGTRFGSDPAVVGRRVRLDGEVYTVVGVMPERFEFVPGEIWAPFRLEPRDYGPGEGPAIQVFGRLARGVSLDEAQAELEVLGRRASLDDPEAYAHLQSEVVPFQRSLLGLRARGPVRVGVFSINLIAVLFLALVCANVSILVFARTATRESEIVVRNALGASRRRIVMQLFVEALVLGGLAALAGVLAAAAVLHWIVAQLAEIGAADLWRGSPLSLSAVLYVGLLTLLGAALVGVLPALKVTGRRADGGIRRVGVGPSAAGFGGPWTAIIVIQIALSFLPIPVLIDVADDALWIRNAEFGFPAAEFLAAELNVEAPLQAERGDAADAVARARLHATYRELERRLMAEPAVSGVTYANHLPGEFHPRRWIEVEGGSAPDSALEPRLQTSDVDPGFFGALGVPLLAGRGFDSRDLGPESRALVVNRSFVEVFLGGRNAVGARVRYQNAADASARTAPDSPPGPWYTIVGVVDDVALTLDPDLPHHAALYHPVAPGASAVRVAVRVRGDPGALAPRFRAIATSVDPALRLDRLAPLAGLRHDALRDYALGLEVGAVVGGLLLLLSFAGIYSVMSFTVSRRTREIGIRIALGADRRRIVTAIFSRGLAQIGLGLVLGFGLLLVLLAVLGGGIHSMEAVGFVAAGAATMLGVGLLACLVPTRRALRIEPTEALRAEG